MSPNLLILVAAPSLEEPLVDWLLEQEELPTFTSIPISGHGGTGPLSVAEQVAGRRRQVMFHVLVDAASARALTEDLRVRFPGSGIRYWITPVLGEGVI